MKMKGRQRCAGARSIDGGRAPHLAASDGQRVRVRHGILAHVELGHVDLQEGGGLLEEGEMIRVVEMTVKEVKEYMAKETVNSPVGFLYGVTWYLQNRLNSRHQ